MNFTENLIKISTKVECSRGKYDDEFTLACRGFIVTKINKRKNEPHRFLATIASDETVGDAFNLIIKFNFELKPVTDKERPGLFMLSAGDIQHPAVVNGFLSRRALQEWLRQEIFNATSYDGGCTYKVMHQQRNLTFRPMLEFGYQQWPFAAPPLREKVYQSRPWYAVPQLVQPGNDRTFVPFAPSWEDDILHSEHNANIVVSLMERLRDFHKMKKLSNYMIKTVVLTELAEGDLDWDQSLDIIFVAVWEKLIQHLNNGKLGRFLSPQYNLFVDMSAVDVEKYYYTANKILQQIKKLQGVEEVTFDNVNNIFFNW